MEAQLNRVALLGLVKAVSQACATRGALPITSHVLLHADKHGIDVAATNLESYLTGHCKAEAKHRGGVCVPSKPLICFLDKVDCETIILQSKTDILTIKAGRAKATIGGMKAEEFPPMPKFKADGDATIYHIGEALRMVNHAIADDDARPVLAGICLDIGAKSLAAADGFRLAVAKTTMKVSKLTGKYNIPAGTVRLMLKLGIDSAHIAIQNEVDAAKGQYLGRIKVTGFDEPTLVLTSMLTSGTYPDYTQLIPKCSHKIAVNVGELLNALALMPKEAYIVRLVGQDKKLKVSAKDSDGNDTEVNLDAKGTIKIAVNPKYLCDVLRLISKDELVTIQTTRPESPLKIEHGKLTEVIMPMFYQWETRKKKEETEDEKPSRQEPVPSEGQPQQHDQETGANTGTPEG